MKNFNYFFLSLITAFSLILSFPLAKAQGTLNLSEADPLNYPNVSCYMSMFDGNGKSVGNLDPKEFSVFENGIQVPSNSITLECTKTLPMNVVVVMDKSTSMSDLTVDGETRWQWAKEGANYFFQQLHLNDTVKCAITTFASLSYITCNFTKNINDLSDSLNAIKYIGGNTNFNVAFLSPLTGAVDLLKTRPPNIRRVIVFLTDGKHEPQTGALQLDAIIAALKDANIQLFAISLLSDGPVTDLGNIASATGGEYYNIDTKLGLQSIYASIADKLGEIYQCKLTWIAPKLCDTADIYRIANIHFNRLSTNYIRPYVAPVDSVVRIKSDKPVYEFDDPEVDQSVEKTLTFTADNQDLVINDVNVVPNTYFEITDYGSGSPVKPSFPIILSRSSSRTFKIKFTQKDIKKLRQATFVIDADPCPREVALLGGVEQIRVKSPEKDNIYTSCDTVNIQWDGVNENRAVNLYYQNLDSGDNLKTIAQSVSGLNYQWHNTQTEGRFKIIARTAPVREYLWGLNFGSTTDDAGQSVTISPNKLYVYATGYITGDATFGTINAKSLGGKDIFIAKFDMDGNAIWVKVCGTTDHDDIPGGITTDNSGNIYVTGTSFRGAVIAGSTPGFYNYNMEYMFLAKLDPAGKVLNVSFIGSDDANIDFRTWGKRVRYNFNKSVGGLIYVDMDYMGSYYDPATQFGLMQVGQRTKVTAVYDIALNLKEINLSYPNYSDYSSSTFNDSLNDNTLQTGSFTGSDTFDKITVNSAGGTDGFLSRFGSIPNSADTSETFFMSNPLLEFSLNRLNCGNCKWGDSLTKDFLFVLHNRSLAPVLIDSFAVTSISTTIFKDFTVLSQLKGVIIKPGDSLTITMKFVPGYTGDRDAKLSVYSTCGYVTSVPLYGYGTCGGLAETEIKFDSLNIGKSVTDTVFCIFRNNSRLGVTINPRLTGNNWTDFSFSYPDYISVKNGKVNLQPGACLDMIITFKPIETGTRECYIDYQVESPCMPANTHLTGIGTATDISVTSFNWDEKRILTSNDGAIKIVNNSTSPEQVDSIKFETPADSDIFTVDFPTMPLKIDPNSKTPISVHFKPTDEVTYSTRLVFYVKDRVDPIYSTLAGIGILPKLNAVWVCGETVNVGDSTMSYIELTNPSKSADLQVKSLDFQSLGVEYTWVDGAPRDTVIHKEESIKFYVLFKPQAGSNHENLVSILADNYDGTFPGQWRETKVSTDCDGINLTYDTPVHFKTHLLCDESGYDIKIQNHSTAQDITLYKDYVISGDSDAFTVVLDQDQIIPPGETVQIPIKFKPLENKTYSAKLKFKTSANIDIVIDLFGEGSRIIPSSEQESYTTDVGKYLDYTVYADFPKLEKTTLNDFNVTLRYDPKVINFDLSTFKPELPVTSTSQDYLQWFTPTNDTTGVISFKGSGILNVPNKFKLFTIKALALLSLSRKTVVTAAIDYGCLKKIDSISLIEVNPYCLNDGRIVDITSTTFFMMAPAPNPSNGSSSIDFGVGFDSHVKMDIYNVLGELIQTPVDMDLKTGGYSIPINTANLPAGVYYVIYQAGYYTDKTVLTVK